MKTDDIPADILRRINGTTDHVDDKQTLVWFAEMANTPEEAAEELLCSPVKFVVQLEKHGIKNEWSDKYGWSSATARHLKKQDGLDGDESKTDVTVEPSKEPPTIENSEVDHLDGVQGIYVLECEDGKFYVGASRDLRRRLKQHFSLQGAWFTKEHPPKSVVDTVELNDLTWDEVLERENERTKEEMREQGWENVRGGEWWSPFISSPPDGVADEPSHADTPKMERLQRIASEYCA